MTSADNPLIHAIELQNQGKTEEAAQAFRRILVTDPNHAAALYSLAVIALNAGDHSEALRLTEIGASVAPAFAPMRFVRGTAFQAAGDKDQALRCYDDALAIDPNALDVLLNSGALLREMLRHGEALKRFNHILTINPNHTGALVNCGIMLTEFKESEKAIAMFERLLALKPDYDYAAGLLAFERLHLCDWSHFATERERIIDGVRNGRRVCKTLAFMDLSDSAEDHYRAARIFSDHYCPPHPHPLWQGERYRHDRIRVAYVSPDLREHPVGHLMAGVFEQHDRSRFEFIAISLGADDGSRLRARMLAVFDRFIDARPMGTAQIAQLLREMEVDIAVDLAGYTADSRAEIFARRPAPIQVNYLGYAGTLGTDYMDYILADRQVIPPDQQRFYAEKVVYLPDAYLPTDGSVTLPAETPPRSDYGLPEGGFVFCAFSHEHKISPPLFDVWMNLLRQVNDSVLWLSARNPLAQKNLCREAEARGIDAGRLIFAGRVPRVEDHLVRYRRADLFLDTHPYNAHTTAADALMVGLPVVTCQGNAFPSRVAASLLRAVDLPELITESLDGYEALALQLATQPEWLPQIRQRLWNGRDRWPLFNTKMFCRHLEAAYTAMWRQYQLNGAVDALSSGNAANPMNGTTT